MKWVKEFLSAKSGQLSSKRLCGFIGWLASIAVLIICTINQSQAPLMIDAIILGSTGLLGVDSVTEIFKQKDNEES